MQLPAEIRIMIWKLIHKENRHRVLIVKCDPSGDNYWLRKGIASPITFSICHESRALFVRQYRIFPSHRPNITYFNPDDIVLFQPETATKSPNLNRYYYKIDKDWLLRHVWFAACYSDDFANLLATHFTLDPLLFPILGNLTLLPDREESPKISREQEQHITISRVPKSAKDEIFGAEFAGFWSAIDCEMKEQRWFWTHGPRRLYPDHSIRLLVEKLVPRTDWRPRREVVQLPVVPYVAPSTRSKTRPTEIEKTADGAKRQRRL